MQNEISEQKKNRLIKVYKIYNIVDWVIAIIIIGTPFALIALEGLGIPSIELNMLIYYIGNISPIIIIPIFIIYSMYTVFCIILYIKVWPIKEIPKGFTYWFDWVLTVFLTVYELFIFYAILFG